MLRADDVLPVTDMPDASDEDRTLVQKIAVGDRDALGELYDRFAPSMLAVARKILGSGREPEDLVQDVFLEAWHRARHFDPARGTVRTWLMLRVRSRCLDRLRAARRTPTVDLEAAKLGQYESRDADASVQRDGRVVRNVLAELQEDQRTVLELAYFGGHSCSEIAAELSIPIGTVKSRMSRAIAELRVLLRAEVGGES